MRVDGAMRPREVRANGTRGRFAVSHIRTKCESRRGVIERRVAKTHDVAFTDDALRPLDLADRIEHGAAEVWLGRDSNGWVVTAQHHDGPWCWAEDWSGFGLDAGGDEQDADEQAFIGSCRCASLGRATPDEKRVTQFDRGTQTLLQGGQVAVFGHDATLSGGSSHLGCEA